MLLFSIIILSWVWDDYSLEDIKSDSKAIIISSETITNEKKEMSNKDNAIEISNTDKEKSFEEDD